jgi:hypothetical protein
VIVKLDDDILVIAGNHRAQAKFGVFDLCSRGKCRFCSHPRRQASLNSILAAEKATFLNKVVITLQSTRR